MKSHKSIRAQSDPTSIAIAIYKDAVAKCSTSRDPRDIDTITRRVQYEGLSFLMITLPQFGRDFENCLDMKEVTSSHFRMFRKCKAIPAFLQGMLRLIFSPKDGRLLDEPSIEAIEGIRQIAYTFKKLRVAYTAEKLCSATLGYLEEEQSFDTFVLESDYKETYLSVCRACWYDICDTICIRDMVPKHGPGAVAERYTANSKYAGRVWHRRLEPYFPYFANAVHNESVLWDNGYDPNYTECTEEQEQPVRVVFVPKDAKGPRTIAIEPTCMQYTQQAISKSLVKWLERSKLTSGHINFSDQTVNQRLAIESSMTRDFATIDLSSASDRVPRSLALDMFNMNPDLRDSIDACRSRTANVPDVGILQLKKFASMGSALCFPVESMYFFTLCVMALLKNRSLPVNVHNCRTVAKDVFVYGDDIIVPTKDVDVVISILQKFNCRVNTTKSHWKGKFRESCGVDAYDGQVVTPTYLRELPPDNKRCFKSLISWCETSNQFYLRGYWRTADLLVRRVESILGTLPIIQDTCAGLGKISFQRFPYDVGVWCESEHVRKVRTWIPLPVFQKDELDSYPALLKCLLRLESLNSDVVDSDHLKRTARHGAVVLKRRWLRPY